MSVAATERGPKSSHAPETQDLRLPTVGLPLPKIPDAHPHPTTVPRTHAPPPSRRTRTPPPRSASPAWGGHGTKSENAIQASFGTKRPKLTESKAPTANSRPGKETRSASTSNAQKDAPTTPKPTATSAPGVAPKPMEPSSATKQNQFSVRSPYETDNWELLLRHHSLLSRHTTIPDSLRNGFNLGIHTITSTYAPPNHHSVEQNVDAFNQIVANEFLKGRFQGPFTQTHLETVIGPFQTSPISLIPKAGKPGKFRAVHNFSHPHSPSLHLTSINFGIQSNEFPCTWGTFSTVAFIIHNLPKGSQACTRDVAEAYRTIPARPDQWPGLVVRLHKNDSFALNLCNDFGLTSAGGAHGHLADAGADVYRA